MLKSVLSAAALSLLVSSAAWAVPTASPVPHFANSLGVLKVGRGDDDRDHHGWDRGWRGLTEMMIANGVVVMTATGRGTAIHIVRTIGRSEAV
jgi:hypothetical protein